MVTNETNKFNKVCYTRKNHNHVFGIDDHGGTINIKELLAIIFEYYDELKNDKLKAGGILL